MSENDADRELAPIDEEDDSGLTDQLHRVTVSTSIQGPLPPPQDLAMYEEILPGAADRILAMAERQAAHRQGMEATVIRSDTRRSLLGLIAGVFIATAFLGVSGLLIWSGHGWEGAVLGTIDIVSIVGAFVYGTNVRRSMLRENRAASGP